MNRDGQFDSSRKAESDRRTDDFCRERAKELYCADGEIEVESNARISRGDGHGAYVAAWVWVPDREEPIED